MTTHFAINVNLCCSWSHLFHWRVDCRCDNSQLNQGCFQIEEIVSKWSNPVLATQVNSVLSSTVTVREVFSKWTIEQKLEKSQYQRAIFLEIAQVVWVTSHLQEKQNIFAVSRNVAHNWQPDFAVLKLKFPSNIDQNCHFCSNKKLS